MYLAVDIGGTKTLLAAFSADGTIAKEYKFATPTDYSAFMEALEQSLPNLEVEDFKAAAVAIPGKVDRKHGIGVAFGNLPWKDVPIERDIERLLHCPVVIENDANLAGLYEAILVKNDFKKVLYITISTGIGSGIITNGVIDPDFADSEAGEIIIPYKGKYEMWERLSSGKAIVRRYGKRASEITDPATWKRIVEGFAVGFIDLIAVIQPEVIIIGGGVGTHFDRYGDFLIEELKRFETPLMPIPPVIAAQHAEEAVIYGCFELIKQTWKHIK